MNISIKNKHQSTTLDDYITKITNHCEDKVIVSKKLIKMENENVTIPTIHNYEEMLNNNYNVQQLKSFAKFYKLKISGNKKELVTRVFVYLKLSFFITKIQKIFRGILQRKFNLYHGPAFKNRKKCTNSSDFITMEDIHEIPFQQFFSYQDSDGFVYGFDIASLYHLIFKSNKSIQEIKNPYNRNLIPEKVVKNLKSIIRISKILDVLILLEIEDDCTLLSNEKTVELKTLALFQNIDSLGNYSDPKWFLSLSRIQILKFIRELVDIWNYRAQLSVEIKRSICPPNGNPFYNINMHYIQTEPDLINIKKYIVEILEKIVNHGVDRDSRTLGAYYVLGALTLVNHSAASSIPWLFQSFSIF
jgi:uncharacterized protein YlaN (UPF0358 family)